MRIPNIVQFFYETPIKWIMLTLHWIMFSFPILITLMTSDLTILIIINMFLFMVLTVNIIYQDCPISIIESLYLDDTMVDNMNFTQTQDKNLLTRGEKTLQCLIVGIMVVTSKILVVLAKYTFLEYITT